jgi:hypothetical protein
MVACTERSIASGNEGLGSDDGTHASGGAAAGAMRVNGKGRRWEFGFDAVMTELVPAGIDLALR